MISRHLLIFFHKGCFLRLLPCKSISKFWESSIPWSSNLCPPRRIILYGKVFTWWNRWNMWFFNKKLLTYRCVNLLICELLGEIKCILWTEIHNREAARIVAILQAQASCALQDTCIVKLLTGNSELLYRTKKIQRSKLLLKKVFDMKLLLSVDITQKATRV